MNNQPIISVENLSKSFHVGDQDILILKDISFPIHKNDFTVIFGPSGCGKSTLLHILLGLEIPTSGTVTMLGQNVYNGSIEDVRSEFRKLHIGMVYQQPNWIKSLTVIENIIFPLLLLGMEKQEALNKAEKLLLDIQMDKWTNYVPTELSSGQQQKIALARALVTDPEIIIADEPTGNLDFQSGEELMLLLQSLNKTGKTIVMVTHDLEYIKFANAAVQILDGKIVGIFGEKDKVKLLRSIKSKRGTEVS
jgi:putative ABC transport system ATP-binding protein